MFFLEGVVTLDTLINFQWSLTTLTCFCSVIDGPLSKNYEIRETP